MGLLCIHYVLVYKSTEIGKKDFNQVEIPLCFCLNAFEQPKSIIFEREKRRKNCCNTRYELLIF